LKMELLAPAIKALGENTFYQAQPRGDRPDRAESDERRASDELPVPLGHDHRRRGGRGF
jgi:hypothetical protein